MSETRELIKLLKQQFDTLKALVDTGTFANKAVNTSPTPSFTPFDPTTKLWKDYWARFCTFVGTNAVPDEREAQVFLTNQSTTVFELLSNLASQQCPRKDINEISIQEIVAFMKDQFNPKRLFCESNVNFGVTNNVSPAKLSRSWLLESAKTLQHVTLLR